jgi:hypothetical protein
MIIREPLVQATYYYLREAPGDSPARRQDRHQTFVTDVYRTLQLLSNWLALTVPDMPIIPVWEAEPPRSIQPLMDSGVLEGRTNVSALLGAYALRNMLLLRVIVTRDGEYEQTVWSMLDERLSAVPTTPSWLYTTRYWCGVAPRPPEDLEQERMQAIKTAFGVLCLGNEVHPHLLVYPDARTETRANLFLGSLAAELDWYAVQARHRRDVYESHASAVVRDQQRAIEQVTHTQQAWATPAGQMRTLMPLHGDLDALEAVYADMLADMQTTSAAAQELHALSSEYRLKLMQSGMWDAAPTVWQAQVAYLEEAYTRIEADTQHIEATLRRIELMIGTIQARATLLQGERERILIYLVGLLGLALLAVLVADTSLTRMVIRLVALAVVAGVVWGGWRAWQRSRVP